MVCRVKLSEYVLDRIEMCFVCHLHVCEYMMYVNTFVCRMIR